STSQIAASIALSFPLNYDSSFSITTGIQPNYTFKSINFDSFSFDRQFDNGYDPNLPNGETFDRNSLSYFNFHMGLLFNYRLERRKNFQLGAAIFNVFNPPQNFNSRNVKLDSRVSIHAGTDYMLNEILDIQPSILFSTQGNFRELVFGANLKYYLNEEYPATNLYAGLWYRNKDAIFLHLGMDYGNLHAGLSYDINVSDLEEAT